MMDWVGVGRTQNGRAGSDGVGYTRGKRVSVDFDSVDHMYHGRVMADLDHMGLVLDEGDRAKTMILWVGDTVHPDVVEDIWDGEGTAKMKGVLERDGTADWTLPAEEAARDLMDGSEKGVLGKMGGAAEAGEGESHLWGRSWALSWALKANAQLAVRRAGRLVSS